MDNEKHTIAVLGAGSWGVAVALSLLRNGHKVHLWGRDTQKIDGLKRTRISPRLPGVKIPDSLFITDNLQNALAGAEAVIFATPAQALSQVAGQITGYFDSGRALVILCKGIEKGTLRRMSEALCAALPQTNPDSVCVLSGPSHAEEVARSQPTSVVAASSSERVAVWTQRLFASATFRVYRTDDVAGVEFGGSVKNIIAVASGITQALRLGDNAQGALITRGLAEMTRLGIKLGAQPLTFAGLSGLGDLVTTCFSRHSRNRNLGEMIGAGISLTEALDSLGMVAEGVDTCVAVRDLAARHSVETPITDQVYQILFEGKDPKQGVRELMGRTLKEEIWV
ncbi:MAG: NAD(P)H-dependent glycerol-3-phosphate dehydrogenase [Candidatus Zixiibacteriota bacterium]